jgi:hypothetical protein
MQPLAAGDSDEDELEQQHVCTAGAHMCKVLQMGRCTCGSTYGAVHIRAVHLGGTLGTVHLRQYMSGSTHGAGS